MKMDLKRIAALMLIAASFGNLSLTAMAEETEKVAEMDPYVFRFWPSKLPEDYADSSPYLCSSPFSVDHTVTSEDWTLFYSGGDCPEIFNLINTTKQDKTGEGNYASVAAYCTDAAAYSRDDTSYRRINLEDSTYFADGAAGRIRAVVLNSYPKKKLAAIQARANSWLRGQGLPEVQELQSGEAILAAQVTIWKLANGDHYTVNQLYDGWVDIQSEYGISYLSKVVDTNTVTQLETEHTAQNIESLYHYLYNLEAVSPRYDVVSESSIEIPAYTEVKENDGSYTVTVTAVVNTTVREGDELTISATCGDAVQNQDVTAAGKYSFTFKGLSNQQEVKLEINGCQNGGDVYLFDAEGDRGASQSMVGYDDSKLPVHGEIVVTPDRILNIFMGTGEESGKIPLANIQFDIYQIATMTQLESGEGKLSKQPTKAEITQYQIPTNLMATLTTDANGFATYNFTKGGKPDGIYIIVERFSAATQGAVEPFFLVIPGTLENGSGYSYTRNIYLENAIETAPDVRMDVTKIDHSSDTYDVGQSHTWIIRSGIPAGLANARKYIITDILDYRLDYETGGTVVAQYTKAGKEMELEADTHYNLAEGTVSVDDRIVDRFSVSLTPAGMAYVAANLGEGEETGEIRVYFNAVINENASIGEKIPNTAHLDYTNSAGVDYDADADAPAIYNGGINLLEPKKNRFPLHFRISAF